MQLRLERRAQQSRMMSVLSPILAIVLSIITFFIIFCDHEDRPAAGALSLFRRSADRPLVDRGPDRQGGADHPDRRRIVVLLPVERVEHRRRGPARRRRHLRLHRPGLFSGLGRAGGDHADGAHGHPRRHALRGHSRLAQEPLQRQRDADHADAGLRRQPDGRLSGAHPVARPGGAQFPQQPPLHRRPDAARGARRQHPPQRASSCWSRWRSPGS